MSSLDYTEIIPVRLWIGPAPSKPDLAELKKLFGSELVVMDLNCDPEEARLCKEMGIVYDSRTPRIEESNQPVPLGKLKVVSAIVGDNVDSGRKVVLHCLKGKGRSPTCAAAYLIQSGMSVAAAKNTITSKRSVWMGADGNYSGLLEEYARIVEFARSGI